MKSTLVSCLLLIFFVACQPAPEVCESQTVEAETAEGNLETSTACAAPEDPSDEVVEVPAIEEPLDSGVPFEASIFAANVSYTNFTSADMDKVEAAILAIQQIIRTPEFKKRVLEHSYQGVFQFVDNRGFSNAEIYQLLLDGSETLLPNKNSAMDLQLELYTNYSTSTVGYTYPNTLKIWMNRKFFDTYDTSQVARNIFHEWTHKLGFGHDSSATARRPYSVPYGLGSIVQDLVMNL